MLQCTSNYKALFFNVRVPISLVCCLVEEREVRGHVIYVEFVGSLFVWSFTHTLCFTASTNPLSNPF